MRAFPLARKAFTKELLPSTFALYFFVHTTLHKTKYEQSPHQIAPLWRHAVDSIKHLPRRQLALVFEPRNQQLANYNDESCAQRPLVSNLAFGKAET